LNAQNHLLRATAFRSLAVLDSWPQWKTTPSLGHSPYSFQSLACSVSFKLLKCWYSLGSSDFLLFPLCNLHQAPTLWIQLPGFAQ
jgi:hypothetical protein